MGQAGTAIEQSVREQRRYALVFLETDHTYNPRTHHGLQRIWTADDACLVVLLVSPEAGYDHGVIRQHAAFPDQLMVLANPPCSEVVQQIAMIFTRMWHQTIELRSEVDGACDVSEYHAVNQALAQANVKAAEMMLELEDAKEASDAAVRAQASFLANMSHEIRTPLHAILGYADLLQNEIGHGDASRCRKMLDTILVSSRHLLNLINNVLDLSKFEVGQMVVERIPSDPTEHFNAVMTLLQPEADEKGIELILRHHSPLPAVIHIDPTRLRQVLINLVGNAIKFTHRGRVTVTTSLLDQDGSLMLRIKISDTGIGMTKDQLSRIFDSFVQADSSTTRRYGGTGLGLVISKHIAAALGGGITVESEPGRGTVFECLMDISAPDGPSTPSATTGGADLNDARSSPGPFPLADLPQAHVLVVDDVEINRDLVEFALRSAGMDVSTASDGLQAVEMATQRPVDLILMDLQMPRMDGYAATQTLRDRGLKCPILALTADAIQEHIDRCLASGCDGYLTKPIEPVALIEAVAKYLQPSAPVETDIEN